MVDSVTIPQEAGWKEGDQIWQDGDVAMLDNILAKEGKPIPIDGETLIKECKQAS